MMEPPVCERCGDEYSLNDGMEPTRYCDPCAQERVDELESVVAQLQQEINTGGVSTAATLLRPNSRDLDRIRKLIDEAGA